MRNDSPKHRRHTCVICMGPACQLKGARDVLAKAKNAHGLKPVTVECLGACAMAPAAAVDGLVLANLGPDWVAQVDEAYSMTTSS